jgi:hypothetical protein
MDTILDDIPQSAEKLEEEVTRLVYTQNVDVLISLLVKVGSEEAKRLADIKDKGNSMPLVYNVVTKNLPASFMVLADVGANLDFRCDAQNKLQHIAAMCDRETILDKIWELGIKPEKNMRNVWPSSLTNNKSLAEKLKLREIQTETLPTHLNFLRLEDRSRSNSERVFIPKTHNRRKVI